MTLCCGGYIFNHSPPVCAFVTNFTSETFCIDYQLPLQRRTKTWFIRVITDHISEFNNPIMKFHISRCVVITKLSLLLLPNFFYKQTTRELKNFYKVNANLCRIGLVRTLLVLGHCWRHPGPEINAQLREKQTIFVCPCLDKSKPIFLLAPGTRTTEWTRGLRLCHELINIFNNWGCVYISWLHFDLSIHCYCFVTRFTLNSYEDKYFIKLNKVVHLLRLINATLQYSTVYAQHLTPNEIINSPCSS